MHPHMDKIYQALERLSDKRTVQEATDAVILNSADEVEFREHLYTKGAWYDIYGAGEVEEYWYHEQYFFSNDWYHNSILPTIETALWLDALDRNGVIDWRRCLYQ